MATVTSEKWNKTKDLFVELEAMMAQPSMSLVRLQQIRGFLIYVARTYRWLTPYIKGLHLTIDGWRKNRDKEGWPQKVQAWEWNSEEWIDVQPSAIQGATLEEAPETVTAVSRLASDLAALKHLTSGEEPATQKCRSREKFTALYLMGDASGQGFGSGLWDKTGLWYDAANWAEHCRDETSNWKEATNLAVKIEEKAREGLLVDAELFVFTDNSVFEGTFFKGHSKSRKLNDVVLRLRTVERESGCILHVIHVAGTRMKMSGIDGLSRGNLLEGMMAGKDPLTFIPLDEDADERSDGRVSQWVQSWWQDESGESWCGHGLKRLMPDDWFDLHNNDNPRLWVPPLQPWKRWLSCSMRTG